MFCKGGDLSVPLAEHSGCISRQKNNHVLHSVWSVPALCNGSFRLYIFPSPRPLWSVIPPKLFGYHVSHFHIVSLSHIWDRALPCAGWCDPQIDSFIHNDKRWVWTGLLIWQSLKCHCDGCWRDPASLATHRIAIAPSSDPSLFIFPGGSRSCLFKKETSNWIKMARSPKTEARAP